MSWPAIVFGWPGVIVSIGLSVVGLGWRSWRLVMAGLVIGTPFMILLSGYPGFRVPALLIVSAYVGALYAVRRGRRVLAACLILPYVGIAGLIAWSVLNQPRY
jgi:hypothetical protein